MDLISTLLAIIALVGLVAAVLALVAPGILLGFVPANKKKQAERHLGGTLTSRLPAFAVFFGIFLLAGGIGSSLDSKADDATVAPQAKTAKSEAAPDKGGKEAAPATPQEASISARALCNTFEENEVAANKRYMDKKIVVSGTISEISTDFTGDPEITLGFGDFEIAGVVCEMANDDGLENLSKGQGIKLKGKVAGYALGFVQMEDCKIVK